MYVFSIKLLCTRFFMCEVASLTAFPSAFDSGKFFKNQNHKYYPFIITFDFGLTIQ